MENRSVNSAGGQKREGDGWSRGRTLLLAIRIGRCLFSEDTLIIMSTNGPASSSLVWTESPSENMHLAKAAASGQKGAVKGNEVFLWHRAPGTSSSSHGQNGEDICSPNLAVAGPAIPRQSGICLIKTPPAQESVHPGLLQSSLWAGCFLMF